MTDAVQAPQTPNPEAPPDERRMQRRMLFGVMLGLLLYAGLALWADLPGIATAIGDVNWWLIPAAMGLSFSNYLVRFIRWERYRTLLGVRMGRGTSFLIHLSGLSLTVTPGKMGEAFKSWLIKEVDGTPVSRTAPIVVAERFTDLLGFLVLIAVGGLATAPQYAWVFWGTLALCVLLLYGLSSERAGEVGLRLLASLPVVGRATPKVRTALASTRVLMAPREILLPTLAATFGWALECTAFWLLADALTPGVPWLFAVFVFALSAVAGAMAIIFPGGLVLTEGLMIGLLRERYLAMGVAAAAASARATTATLVVRLCTLWFAMGLGLVALSAFRRLRRRGAQSTGPPSTGPPSTGPPSTGPQSTGT
jgi:glycosyltransferase 2 family protein